MSPISKHIDIIIRHAKESDFPQINQLQNQAFPGDVLLLTKQEMYERCHGKKKGAILVALDKEKIIGYCVLTERPWRPWTGWDFLAVDPLYQRKGVANKLTKKVFQATKRPFIRLFTESKNNKALSLYKKWNFFQTGLKKEFYTDGDDAVVLLGLRFLKSPP